MEQKPRVHNIGSIDGFISPKSRPPQNLRHKQVPEHRQAQPINTQSQIAASYRPVPLPPPPIINPEPPARVESSSLNKQVDNFQRYYSPYSQAPNASVKRPEVKKKRWFKNRVVQSVLVVFLLFFGVGSWYGTKLLANIDKVFHGNLFSDAQALFSNAKLKGEAQGRVNILLAGDSADDPNHQGADLTDSIMIVSLDTKTNTGFMLSIPRDLWVDIPSLGHQKINAANDVTNFHQSGYPSGGMGQLQQIVQSDLGIPIDYYALIDYTAFRDSVNAVGGIQINIQSNDPRGLYDTFTHLKLPNGEVTLDGQEALDLARARGDDVAGDRSYGFPNSDFDRTMHQRQMLTALEKKAKTIGVLANPIKVTQLFDALGNNVQTNLNLQQVLRLDQLTKGLNLSHLQSITYSYGGSNSLLSSYSSPDGESALAPSAGVDDFSALQQYYQQLTSSNPVVREAPTAVVLNGTNINGLARTEGNILKQEGFNVLSEADTTSLYNSSMVVDSTNGQKPASKQLLQTLMPKDTSFTNSQSTATEAKEAQNYSANFVVILGQDSANVQQP